MRLNSIDLLRGLVMVLMVLDHTRDFFAAGSFNPRDVNEPALFLTRWITHFCAPVFVFLAGASAFLYGARGRTVGEVSRFLFTRGLMLVLLEVTIVRFAWTFSVFPDLVMLQVIWAIGVSMIAVAGLIHLPRWAIGAIGIGMITGHNLLDGIQAEQLGQLGWLWHVLHQPAFLHPTTDVAVFALYPLIPWVGVMAAGHALGPVMLLEPASRRRWLVGLGVGVTLGFVLLRAANVYGDPAPWARHDDLGATLLSFINNEKYPPIRSLPRHDAWPGLGGAGGVRIGEGQGGAVLRHLRTRAPLLLCRAPPARPRDGRGLRRSHSRRCRVAVRRSADRGQVGGLRAGAAGRLPGVGPRGGAVVPAVPLVRGGQAPAQRTMVELSLTAERQGGARRASR